MLQSRWRAPRRGRARTWRAPARGDLPGLLVGQVAQPHRDQREGGLEHPRIDLAPPRDAVQEHGIDAPVTNDRTEPVPTLDQTGAVEDEHRFDAGGPGE